MKFNPKFTITNKILKHIAQIESAKELVENSPLIPFWERRFKEEATAKIVYHTTHIEGNPLNYGEAKKILEGRTDEVVAKSRDIQEIINYRKAISFIESQKEKDKKITEKIIRKIHEIIVDKILPKEQAGQFRNPQVVLISSKNRKISFKPPLSSEVPGLVRAFCKWHNLQREEDLSPILKAGITQVELARIHPFVDGNGRMARAVTTLSLYKDGYDIKRFFCLDEFYDRDAEKYYKAIQTVKKENDDFTFWLEYFCFGLAFELNRVKERVLKLSKDLRLKKKAGQIILNERQEKIVLFIEDYGRISNKNWRELFPDVSDDTILRDLKDLVKKKVVRKKGKTKAASYVLF